MNISHNEKEHINCHISKNYPNSLYRQMRQELKESGHELGYFDLLNSGTSYYLSQKVPGLKKYKNLNIPEIAVIYKYTGPLYDLLNMSLWSDDTEDILRFRATIKTLCNGLSKLPNYRGVVTRGTKRYRSLLDLKKGDTWKTKPL